VDFAQVAWGGFYAALLAASVGILAGHRGRPRIALGFLGTSALVLLLFSMIGGFSVGRVTILLPVLIGGYVLGMGRGWVAVFSGILIATIVYLLGSWWLTDTLNGAALGIILAFWGAPIDFAFLLVAFAMAVANPSFRHRPQSMARSAPRSRPN